MLSCSSEAHLPKRVIEIELHGGLAVLCNGLFPKEVFVEYLYISLVCLLHIVININMKYVVSNYLLITRYVCISEFKPVVSGEIRLGSMIAQTR